MKIGIDCRFLNRAIEQKPGGSTGHGVYVYNLVKNLSEIDDQNEYNLYLLNNCDYKLKKSNFNNIRMSKLHNNGYLRSTLTFPVELWRNPVDIFHGLYSIPILKLKRAVLTMFEFSWLLFPQYYSKRVTIPAGAMIKMAVSRASMVITGSKFMKEEVLNYFKIPEERIEAIPLGVDEVFFEHMNEADIRDMRKRFKIEADYILAVGDLWPKKNMERLVAAFCILKKSKNFDLELVLTGGNLWKSEQLFRKIHSSGFKDSIIMTGYVSPRDLKLLYQGAQLFVFPSLYEGFGLPVLEAMASNTPVAVSNISSIPEVAGDAGVYFDPYNTENIASTILKVIDNSELRERLIKRGRERAEKFTWLKVSERTLFIYRNIA